MAIKLSDLPVELQRQILATTDLGPKRRAPRRARSAPSAARLSRGCRCGFFILRPDGLYPDRCDGCGKKWPASLP